MKKISTIFRQIGSQVYALSAIAMLSMPLFFSCVDNDDDVPETMYTSKKMTAGAFLEANKDRYSDFIALLKRTPYFSMMTTYGRYTLFAPTNDAMSIYIKNNGYGSVDGIPQTVCDSVARTHIIRSGAYFTSDVPEGKVGMNMLDAFVTWTSDSDVVNNNRLIYYVNKNSRMIEYNDSVTNGVVHTIDHLLGSTNDLLPEWMEED
ncbi:MAG: fasciclin domain-containing protein, partial [Prevotella sp.]|nr:fasciclin domain-containing protein [Prevotella sp.]